VLVAARIVRFVEASNETEILSLCRDCGVDFAEIYAGVLQASRQDRVAIGVDFVEKRVF
jgi:hypothetical protein